MNRSVKIALVLFLAQFSLAATAHARRAMRPWMGGHRAPKQTTALQPDKVTYTRSVSSVETKRISSSNPSSSSADGFRIAKQATRYEGTRYRFGGTSKFWGVDCSGLVQRVYKDLDLDDIPRTSAAMYKKGKPVHLNELQPGDLVFFKNTYKRGVSHVGVYAGENRFVHAQNRRHGVIITSMADPYYQLHYAGARNCSASATSAAASASRRASRSG